MLIIGGKKIESLVIGGKRVSAVWKGDKLIWEGVNCCFGSGAWRGDKPWVGSVAWK